MSTKSNPARPHFLLPTDLPPELPHLQFAVKLGERLHAQVTLFHAMVTALIAAPEAIAVASMLATSRNDCRQAVWKVAHELGASTPPHVAVDSTTDPAQAILDAARRLRTEMILLPTHARTGLTRALLGSVAERVLRRSTRPVLLLTDAMGNAEQRTGEPGAVLLATDLSPAAGPAARTAADLARRLRLPLVLFSVVPTQEPPPQGGGAPVAAAPTPPLQRIQDRLRELRRFGVELAPDLDLDVTADIHDDPAAAIVHEAKVRGASLLVVGTHGRRGLSRLLLGSVAERIVRTATTPTVCVPTAAG